MEEVRGWVAFERAFGPLLAQDRIDFGLAHVAFRVAQSNAKRPRSLRFKDFLPPWVEAKRGSTPEELEAFLKGLIGAAS